MKGLTRKLFTVQRFHPEPTRTLENVISRLSFFLEKDLQRFSELQMFPVRSKVFSVPSFCFFFIFLMGHTRATTIKLSSLAGQQINSCLSRTHLCFKESFKYKLCVCVWGGLSCGWYVTLPCRLQVTDSSSLSWPSCAGEMFYKLLILLSGSSTALLCSLHATPHLRYTHITCMDVCMYMCTLQHPSYLMLLHSL